MPETQYAHNEKIMEEAMKNTMKKIATILSAALITLGAANVYAMDFSGHEKGDTAYEVWQERSAGNRIS